MKDVNSTQVKGNITEQRCFLKCLEMGLSVSKPLFDNERYDFILDTGQRLFKVQVKTSRWKNDEHDSFCFSCRSQHATGKGNKIMSYTKKEIDFFMTERDGIFYLWPAPEKGMVEKTLRVTTPKQGGNRANIDYAKDYIFEEVIKLIIANQ